MATRKFFKFPLCCCSFLNLKWLTFFKIIWVTAKIWCHSLLLLTHFSDWILKLETLFVRTKSFVIPEKQSYVLYRSQSDIYDYFQKQRLMIDSYIPKKSSLLAEGSQPLFYKDPHILVTPYLFCLVFFRWSYDRGTRNVFTDLLWNYKPSLAESLQLSTHLQKSRISWFDAKHTNIYKIRARV